MRPALSPCLVGCVRARRIKKGRGEEGEGGGLKEYFYMTMGERELFFFASGICLRVRVRGEVLR